MKQVNDHQNDSTERVLKHAADGQIAWDVHDHQNDSTERVLKLVDEQGQAGSTDLTIKTTRQSEY